jgi:iron complex transport system substrate-binding protein
MAAGFRNLAIELGLSGTGQLPLETLLAANPEVLIMGQARVEPTMADENFRHPALERSFARRPKLRIAERYWICGSPLVAAAIEQLAAFRETSQNRAATGPGAIAMPSP